jgi:hypothetical protein
MDMTKEDAVRLILNLSIPERAGSNEFNTVEKLMSMIERGDMRLITDHYNHAIEELARPMSPAHRIKLAANAAAILGILPTKNWTDARPIVGPDTI